MSTEAPKPIQGTHLTLTDHLTELRTRLVRALIAILLGSLISWTIKDYVFALIRSPIAPYLPTGGLVFTNPMDLFIANIKVAVMTGVILSCPIWLYQVWKFVSPGLYSHERKYGLIFIGSGTGLFFLGVLFVYFMVLPMAFKFLLTLGAGIDKPMITVSEYLGFFITTTLVFGAAFELPLILTLLGMIGIVDQQFLREKRRVAVVGLAALSAIVTPPDALSMLMLLGPLCLLYETSIVTVGIVARKRDQT